MMQLLLFVEGGGAMKAAFCVESFSISPRQSSNTLAGPESGPTRKIGKSIYFTNVDVFLRTRLYPGCIIELCEFLRFSRIYLSTRRTNQVSQHWTNATEVLTTAASLI